MLPDWTITCWLDKDGDWCRKKRKNFITSLQVHGTSDYLHTFPQSIVNSSLTIAIS